MFLQGLECVSPMPDSDMSDIFWEDDEFGSDPTVGKKKRVRFQFGDKEPEPISSKRKLDEALGGAFGKFLRDDNSGAPKMRKCRTCVLCRQEGHDKRNCPLKVRGRFYMNCSELCFQSQ